MTKHGKPVARVVPVDDGASLKGSVEFLVDEAELLAPLGEGWDAERSS